ncbi:MAG: DNA-processing protein DprA [Aquabacterium sp.]
MSEAADELAAWLRLLLLPRVSRADARRLLGAYGSAAAVFEGSPATWRALLGRDATAAVAAEPPAWRDLVEQTRRWQQAGADRRVVTLADQGYPQALLNTADPPLLLYAQGRVELLNRPALAIVGSRSPTAQGADNARAFARDLAKHGLVIVSGMAAGIDAAAHEGALHAGGDTIAVYGTGIDIVYPSDNRGLAQRIASSGLLISEFPLGTPGLAGYFLQRNRVIAGLCRGTLVIEAAVRSGSLSTARQAAECGREVMAVPGSIHSPQSRGCHALIRQGAKLIETSADVLDELRLGPPPAPPRPRRPPKPMPGAGAEEQTDSDTEPGPPVDPVLQAMGHDPVTLDALLARTGQDAAMLQTRLLELELAGQVARLPGALFQRRGSA